MKLEAVITRGVPDEVVDDLGGDGFAMDFLAMVVGDCLGVEHATQRPAEFCVQEPDRTVCVNGHFGVELRLTGVSRQGRSAKEFHDALKSLVDIAKEHIARNLKKGRVQLFCVIMLDGDVETSPGSGVYSNTLESEAIWITTSSHSA